MVQPKEKSPVAIGCSSFIIGGATFGGIWVLIVLLTNFNGYLAGFIGILCAYVIRHARYIFIKSTGDEFLKDRQTCFLAFPCLSNILLFIIWHLSHNWTIAVITSIGVGWLITKALQISIFSHEYTYRNNPEKRVTKPLDKRFTKEWMDASLMNSKGIMLATQGLFKEAQNMFEQAIEAEPDYPQARISLSNILLHNGRYSQAELQIEKAMELGLDDKNNQNALNNLANIRVAQKNYKEAIKRYEEAIAVYKPDHEIYYNLGIPYEQLGEWERALKCYQLSNDTHSNEKARAAASRIQQRMQRSQEICAILDSYSPLDIQYPEFGRHSLSEFEEKILKKISESPLIFFVGAGISYPYKYNRLKFRF